MGREDIMKNMTERDSNPDESVAKDEKDLRAFIDFLVRHPDRRKQFIGDFVNAGARREAVGRLLDDAVNSAPWTVWRTSSPANAACLGRDGPAAPT